MNDVIRNALSHLDPDRDEDWTANGLPKVEVVAELVGEDVTRAQIGAAAPGFTRSNLLLGSEPSPAAEPPRVEPPTLETAVETAIGITAESSPPAAEPLAAPADRRAELTAQVEEMQRKHAVLRAAAERAQSDLLSHEQAMGAARLELQALTPKLTPAEEYALVVARSIERRQLRAQQALQPRLGDPRSRLDQRLGARRRAERRAGAGR